MLSNGYATAPATSGDQIDRLGRHNGWTADLKEGDCSVYFFQGDAITSRRDIVIAHPPDQPFATFSCASPARLNARTVTTAQMALFPARNSESCFGKWQFSVENGVISASLRYVALTGGLDAGLFKAICVSMLTEVAFVEQILHGQGLL
jgi:hypothetical protein